MSVSIDADGQTPLSTTVLRITFHAISGQTPHLSLRIKVNSIIFLIYWMRLHQRNYLISVEAHVNHHLW